MASEEFILEEVAYDIEDETIINRKIAFSGMVAYHLGQMAFAGSWWSHPETITTFTNEPAGR